MARPVPIGEIEPQVPVEEGLRRVIPQRSGISTGPALEDLGSSVERVAQGQAANFTMQTMSQAQKEWTQHLLERQQTSAPGAPGFTAALEKDYSDYVSKAVKGAPSPLAGKMLSLKLSEFGSQLLQHSIAFEGRQRQSNDVNVATKAIDDSGNELMLNPQLFGQRLAERRDLINQLNLDPDVRQKLVDHATDTMAKFATMGAIEQDPYKAMLDIQNPKNLYSKVLTPELREQLMDHADRVLHQRVADAERLESMTQKAEDKQAQEIVKQGILKSQSGQLTGDWVRRQAPLLKPNELEFLFNELSGKEVKSDIHVYSDLLTRASNGGDVESDAKDALLGGKLSKEDWTRIQDMSAKDHPGWFKRGSQFLNQALDPGQLNPDPAAHQSKAYALEEWDDWSRKHPQASEAEAKSQYEELAHHYQMIPDAKVTLLMKAPIHLIGTRANPLDEQGNPDPMLNATARRMMDALKAGQITEEEAQQEAILIQQYRKISQDQASAKAKKDKK